MPFDATSFIERLRDEKMTQRVLDPAGSPAAIFAHPDEGGPVPGTQQAQQSKREEAKAAVGAEKGIEIGQAVVEPVTDALDGIEGNAAHGGHAGNGSGFHVDEGGIIGGGQAALFLATGDARTGDKPERAGAGLAMKALAGTRIDDAGDIVGEAGGDLRTQGAGPADGENKIDRPAVFNAGEGAGGGGLAGAGASGNPLFLLRPLGPEMNAVTGGVGPAQHERLQLPGHCSNDGNACHVVCYSFAQELNIILMNIPPIRCPKCGAKAYAGSKGSLCPRCLRTQRQHRKNRVRAWIAVGVTAIVLAGIALLATYFLTGRFHAAPAKSQLEMAAERAREEAISRVRAETNAGKISADDEVSQEEIQGELAYREALHADVTRPTDEQITAWSSALHYKMLRLTRQPELNCAESVELEKAVEKPQLEAIAKAVLTHECVNVTPIILNFYLPGMQEDGPAWASAQYEPSEKDPNPQFTIKIGATEAEPTAKGGTAQKSDEVVVGTWIDRSDGFRTTIVKRDGRYYEDFSVQDPTHPVRNALEALPSRDGEKFLVKGSGTGEYYIVTADGTLKEYDHQGYIKTIPRSPQ